LLHNHGFKIVDIMGITADWIVYSKIMRTAIIFELVIYSWT